jgi:hypothetical protein
MYRTRGRNPTPPPERRYSQEDFCKDLCFLAGLPGIQGEKARSEKRQAYFAAKYPDEADRNWRMDRCTKAAAYFLRQIGRHDDIPRGHRIVAELTPAAQLTLWDFYSKEEVDPGNLDPSLEDFFEKHATYAAALNPPKGVRDLEEGE